LVTISVLWAQPLPYFSLWIVLTASLQIVLLDDDDGWRELPIIGLFAAIPLFVTFLPMLLCKSPGWLRGRLVVEVVGAAVYALLMWLVIPNVLARH